MAATKLMDTGKAFMDVSITTGNPVYRDSSAVITLDDTFNPLPASGSGVGTDKCWMIDHELPVSTGSTVTSCSQTATSVITITNMKQNAAGKQFRFRVLASFVGTTSAITQAVTKTVGADTIDDSSALLTVTRGSAGSYTLGLAPLVGRAGYSGTAAVPLLTAGSDPGTASNSQALYVAQTLTLATGTSSNVTISLPLTHTNPGADY
jgi:hypothetical protein